MPFDRAYEKVPSDIQKRIGGMGLPAYSRLKMSRKPEGELRRGWTTGACATAAVKAALTQLWGGAFPSDVSITLPKGETPVFSLAQCDYGDGWAEVGITKDAGDDPDVTHGALIVARVAASPSGVVFKAGTGVGTVTKPGLPIAVGEPAINPMPRTMMTAEVEALAQHYAMPTNVEITISIPGGQALALKTWNPRLGIEGGLSVLGTTGVVRPFSCAAWIASIHRGIDVARADGLTHVAGCTGAQSEAAVQKLHRLPDHAMLDMGDFAGGLIKYLAKHPIERITIGGGIAKMTKLAQGSIDLHSGRSQVDFEALAQTLGTPKVAAMNTALEVLQHHQDHYPNWVAVTAKAAVERLLKGTPVKVDTVVTDRAGTILAQAS